MTSGPRVWSCQGRLSAARRELLIVPLLSCYRIRLPVYNSPEVDFADVVEVGNHQVLGPVEFEDFTAMAYVLKTGAHAVSWADFAQSGFPGLLLPLSMSPSALVVVRAQANNSRSPQPYLMFAFAFGPAGRHLLRSDAYDHGYGLRTALNLLYPRSSTPAARLRAVDTKRRGSTIVRSRHQVSQLANFESFDVNRLRDIVSKATGVPADADTWGGRVVGGDALNFYADISFDQLGELCRRIEAAHSLDDYTDRFDWIDHIQAVTDPWLVDRLQEEVVRRFRDGELDDFALAPPEIVEWDKVASFRYPFDRAQGRARSPVTHPELRLVDYVAGLVRTDRLRNLDIGHLRTSRIHVLDADGSDYSQWTAWRCLVGELTIDGQSYILDEGEFFQVRADYLKDLDAAIEAIPSSTVALPASSPGMTEGDYNCNAAAVSSDLLLLDRKTVRISSKTTPIEICDLLSTRRQLIHVKRHLGSSDLSHLFAQGLVSADLLQMDEEFRLQAEAKIREVAKGRGGFDFFDGKAIDPSEFEVVYAIIERWRGRRCADALPFFSKINLREVERNLHSRGFKVRLNQIQM